MAQTPPRKRSKQPPELREVPTDAVRISVLITKAERQQLKVMAATRGVTISEVVRQGISRFLRSDS
jgi:hypothetical protein